MWWLKYGQLEVVIYTYLPKPTKLTYLPVFFFPDFYFLKTLANNTKGIFHLKSPKNDKNGGEGVVTFMYTGYSFNSPLK